MTEQTNTPFKPLLIGVTGGSGSGKSSFIRRLRERFTEVELCILPQDEYYRPLEEQKADERGQVNFDLPRSFDKKAFVSDVHRLLNGETVERAEYVYNVANASKKVQQFKPAPIIVVEGLFVFHYKKVAPLFDLKVFINAKDNLTVIRRIYRDQLERSASLDYILYQFEHHVMPSYEKYILPYKDEADIVINNNRDFERGLDVLAGYMENHLRKGVKNHE
jgi:uridine kinase